MRLAKLSLSLVFVVLSVTPAFAERKPIRVVATVGMVADTVAAVGGDAVSVQTLISAGGDPHLYKASPKDVMALATADMIFYNGLLLEGKMAEILAQYSKKKPALALGEQLAKAELLQPVEFQGHFDPHIWMDVSLWSKTVNPVRDALAKFDPSRKDIFDRNAEAFILKLEALHRDVAKLVASIPREQRVLVTAHDAFNYFGRAYDIEVRGIQGISTESEAGLKDINSIVDFLVARKIGAVFVESSVSEKNVMALIEGAKSRGHHVTVGGELYSDAMGAPGTAEGSYLGMIRHNAELIARGLGGAK